MPRHPFAPPRGTFAHVDVPSRHLEGNLLGDPATRRVYVYLPPGHENGGPYPLLVDLVGFTGSGPKHLAWRAFDESVPQKVDRLVAEGKMGEVVVAFPDCFTRLGGNQYVDSLAMGHWEGFLLDDMLPALEQAFPIAKGRDHRGVFGKSSGGYGAMAHAMKHGDAWGAAACHSGDMAFEWCYLPDFPGVLDALAKHGGIPGFLDHVDEARKVGGGDLHVLMTLAMAATYDPDPRAPCGVRLPVDLTTCELDPERWAAWLAHDPVRLADRPEVQESLGSLEGLYVDCGDRDQYHLHYGARQLVAKLERAGIAHRYAHFDDTHSGVDYRMDQSLPFLYAALAG